MMGVCRAGVSSRWGSRRLISSWGSWASSALPLAVQYAGKAGADARDHHERALGRRMLGDEEHVHAVQHTEIDGLVELARQLLEVRPHDRRQIALGHGEAHDAGSQVKTPGGGVGVDEVLVLEGAADAVDRGPRQTGPCDQLAEGQSSRRVGRQQPQDRGGPGEHLDAVALFLLHVAIGLDHESPPSSCFLAPAPRRGSAVSPRAAQKSRIIWRRPAGAVIPAPGTPRGRPGPQDLTPAVVRRAPRGGDPARPPASGRHPGVAPPARAGA